MDVELASARAIAAADSAEYMFALRFILTWLVICRQGLERRRCGGTDRGQTGRNGSRLEKASAREPRMWAFVS